VRLGDHRDATSLRFLARCLEDMDPQVLTPLLEERWLDGYDQPALLAAVACPVLLLRGDERFGGMLPRADGQELAGCLADCTWIDLKGTGHALHWLEAESTARFVLGFLESIQ
jgi:pimeloyl-ACP methyl ester carboxylesterase